MPAAAVWFILRTVSGTQGCRGRGGLFGRLLQRFLGVLVNHPG
jgi:hypothetical protein